MSEEKQTAGSERGKKPTRTATAYLIILFLAAMLLLVLSFFMQQRQELMDLNNTSIAASRNITELQVANQQLELQLQETKKELEKSAAALKEAESEAGKAQKQADALEWLRQIEAATRSSYPKAKELTEAFEETGLKEYLPEESVVEDGTSPAETYQNLYNMLID